MELEAGKKLPVFSLPDAEGKIHKNTHYKGKWLIIYFYPKDNTPGCTKEACAFKDNFSNFKKHNIEIIGISIDSEESHKKFIKKYNLPFTLLADTEKKFVKECHMFGRKKFMGREYDGTFRKSILVDPEGRVKKIYEKVKPVTHAEEVLEDVISFDE